MIAPRYIATLALALALLLPAPAVAADSPWWGLSSTSRPSSLPRGGEGAVVARATNIGDGEAVSPITLTDTLPPGVNAKSVVFHAQITGLTPQNGINDLGTGGPYKALHLCTVAARQVSCTYEDRQELESRGVAPETAAFFGRPLVPFVTSFEVAISVEVEEGAAPAPENELSISAPGTPVQTISRPLEVSEEPTDPGIASIELRPEEEGGSIDSRAGSHPFQLTSFIALQQGPGGAPIAPPKDITVALPPGLAGRVAGLPQCTAAQFSNESCPAQSAVGVANFWNQPAGGGGLGSESPLVSPIFNLTPAYGEPARFGAGTKDLPILFDTSIRSGPGENYGVDVASLNTTQISELMAAEVTFWGTPGDSRHALQRGPGCLHRAEQPLGCQVEPDVDIRPLLTLPASCPAEPFTVSVSDRSWLEAATGPHPEAIYRLTDPTGQLLAIEACNQVPFSPTTHAEPTSNAATSPTGLSFDLDAENPGLSNPEGIAESQIKKAVVTLPEGFTANPSVAAGLGACPQSAYEATTLEAGTGCPEDSKIGEVEAESPLVEGKVTGSLYVARQHENPFGNLLTIYMVFKNPELGVLVRSAGKVEPNPVTGQLTTTFDELPQLPISHFHLFFRQGQRAPLITPPACGTYAVKSLLYPWSNPEVPREENDAFQITVGPEGGGCPSGGVPPFHPGLEAGSYSNHAAAYSPFYLRLNRKDSEQEITHFSIKLPPGLLGKLAGVSYCPDAGIAQAKSREREGGGGEEEAAPSCPSSSQVGRTEAGTGVGTTLAWVPGKVYLAGPYHGAPLSIVAITAAKVGPFDLGTVVVREALRVNPETAEVFIDATGSDPLPHIVDGIPVHLRDIRVYVDRPGFTLNPTDCEPTSTASTVLGSGANFASEADDDPVTVSSPFQVTNCASLGFKPTLKIMLKGGKTHRGGLPALKSILTAPLGEANIAKAQITLPPSEILEQGHLHDVCTKSVWTQGTVPGENCPANSVYGHARAYTPLLSAPLEGNVYLRTGYGTKLPELVAALDGRQINVDVVGTIDSVHKKGSEIASLRTTFASVPDAPVSKFELELEGGRKGLLTNTTDICQGTHKATAAFTGQNGKLDEFRPTVTASCKGQKKGRKAGHGHGKKGHAKKGH